MTEAYRSTLADFARALRREADYLSAHPNLLWQQLCNRLQWSESARKLVDAEADRRAADQNGPIWFRTRTPFRESDALMGTLHHTGVQECALSPDGTLLSSSGSDGSVRLWDTATGAELGRTDDAGNPVVSCAFDRDGRLLVTGGQRGTVTIRDAQTLTELGTFPFGGDAAARCAASPVEPVAAIASGEVLHLIELPSGRVRASASVRDGAFSCCAFSNDGQTIATGDDKGVLRLWRTGTLSEFSLLECGAAIETCAVSPIYAFILVAFSQLSAVLLIGGPDEAGTPRTIPVHFFRSVNDCCISPDGKWLVAASDDHLTWLYELEDLKRPASALEGHSAPVGRCTFAANGSLLATVGRDDTVRLWDPWRARGRGGIAGHRERVTAVAFAPDGSFIVSASADGDLKMWEPAPTAERRTLSGHLAEVWDCVVLEGGGLIASAAGDGTVRLWDVASARETRVLQIGTSGLREGVHALAYGPAGGVLAAGHGDSLSLWNLATGERIGHAAIGAVVHGCVFTPDDQCLLLACADGTLRLWDAAASRELRVLRGHTGLVSCCAVVHDGAQAVSGSQDGTLRLWDLKSGAELHVFAGHTDEVWDCAVSANGAIVASAGYDGSLRLWHLASRTLIATFSVPERLRSVALHPVEPRVVCGDERGWLRVADVSGLYPYQTSARG